MPLPRRLRLHRIKWQPAHADTPDGLQHASATPLDAYQEEQHMPVTVEGGSETISTVQVWVDPTPVQLGDLVEVTLASGQPATLRVLAVETLDGSRRAAHTALKLG